MLTCTFFGHRECPPEIRSVLKSAVEDLIVNQGVELFYVGNQGQFDGFARGVLRELAQTYPQIRYAVVLAYLPGEKEQGGDYSDTMVPEGIEQVHPKYAISWRNRWMLRRSDIVVTYITHTWGGAYSYAQQARKQGKALIPLAK